MHGSTSNEPPKSKLLYHRLLAVYIKQHFHAGLLLRRFSARYTPLMMGHYTYEGPYVSVRILVRKGHMQISRYAADHRVAFPDLLNTSLNTGADKGQL